MKITTPTATCTNGHTHVSWFAAETCSRNAAPMPTTYGPLTQAERGAVSGMPCSA